MNEGKPVTQPTAHLVGINHIALEVDDLDGAIDFYRRLFSFELRGRHGDSMAFLDAGDQFIALSTPRRQPPDEDRHFGLVVDDLQAVRDALEANGVEILPGRGLDFRDPSGQPIQIVEYADIQYDQDGRRASRGRRHRWHEDAESAERTA